MAHPSVASAGGAMTALLGVHQLVAAMAAAPTVLANILVLLLVVAMAGAMKVFAHILMVLALAVAAPDPPLRSHAAALAKRCKAVTAGSPRRAISQDLVDGFQALRLRIQ